VSGRYIGAPERSVKRTFSIGMPQMAVGCLSENWLLKELGSLHWDRLCDSLSTTSHSLTDTQGRRLYATFVRIKFDLAENLAAFHEGDTLAMSIDVWRFGRSTILSTIEISSDRSAGQAQLMTTFSFRNHEDNKALAKSEPKNEYNATVKSLAATPSFFTEYSEVRRAHGRRKLEGLFEAYQINPFIDSNGANLLYFASYQSIHDFLSARATPSLFTKSRDICYFRNCDLSDKIALQGDVLFRVSDRESVAHVTTVKTSS
jgi:probable biosynthetic protein (TIGR04098 family)